MRFVAPNMPRPREAALIAEVEVACLVLRQPAARLIAGRQCTIMPMLQPISLFYWSSATKHPAMGWEQNPRGVRIFPRDSWLGRAGSIVCCAASKTPPLLTTFVGS
jgi:hypothetical protein